MADGESSTPHRHTVYLGLGANLDCKEETIAKAVKLIAGQIGTVERQSALFYSEPWGFRSDNSFVNAVIRVATSLSPRRLLRATQHIERQLGKTVSHATERHPARSTQHGPAVVYHDRPIDIDILIYDDLVIDEPGLTIPHPLMQERDFVMIPLREIQDTTIK